MTVTIISNIKPANLVAHRLASFTFDSNVHFVCFTRAIDIILDALIYDYNNCY